MNVIRPNFADPFVDLPEALHAEMRQILEAVQNAGLFIERDPTMTAVGIGIDRGIYRLALLTNPTTKEKRFAILDPTLAEMSKDEFLALVAALAEAPATEALAPLGSLFRNDPLPESVALRTLNVLDDIRSLLVEIRDRLACP